VEDPSVYSVRHGAYSIYSDIIHTAATGVCRSRCLQGICSCFISHGNGDIFVPETFFPCLADYIYVYVCICIYMSMYIYIYII